MHHHAGSARGPKTKEYHEEKNRATEKTNNFKPLGDRGEGGVIAKKKMFRVWEKALTPERRDKKGHASTRKGERRRRRRLSLKGKKCQSKT